MEGTWRIRKWFLISTSDLLKSVRFNPPEFLLYSERTWRIIWFQHRARGRDGSHYTRFLRAPSQLNLRYPVGVVVGHCASSAGQESEQPDLTLQFALLWALDYKSARDPSLLECFKEDKYWKFTPSSWLTDTVCFSLILSTAIFMANFNVFFKLSFSCCCFVDSKTSFPRCLKQVSLNNELYTLNDRSQSVVMLHSCLDITRERDPFLMGLYIGFPAIIIKQFFSNRWFPIHFHNIKFGH